jgi:hypothetical protein
MAVQNSVHATLGIDARSKACGSKTVAAAGQTHTQDGIGQVVVGAVGVGSMKACILDEK